MELDLRHIRILDALRREGSFRRAAARLGVSQPALSRQVTRIERQVGVQLVERNPGGAVLTEAGRIVVRHALAINAAMDEMSRELRMLVEGGEDRLTVAASLNPAVTVPHLIAQGYQVHVKRVDDDVAVSMVTSGKADLAFVVDDVACPYQPSPGVRAATVMETPMWVCLPDGYPLADRERVAVEDLSHEPWLIPSSGNLAKIVKTTFANAGFTPYVRLAAEMDILLPAVESGTGVALASPLCGRFFDNRFAIRPLTNPPPERKLCLWRPDRVSTAVVRGIINAQQSTHRQLAPLEPEYGDWLARNPLVLPSAA